MRCRRRWIDDPIPTASRYLATVRRARSKPLAEQEILSDDVLVDLLKAKGFDLARRTVAKYREASGIGSSIQRRRQRKMSGG